MNKKLIKHDIYIEKKMYFQYVMKAKAFKFHYDLSNCQFNNEKTNNVQFGKYVYL